MRRLKSSRRRHALHGKIKLILNPGVSDSDTFAIRRRTMDQYTKGAFGDGPTCLKVKKEQNHKNWARCILGSEETEWQSNTNRPRRQSVGSGQTLASFWSSTGWTVESSALQQLQLCASAKELRGRHGRNELTVREAYAARGKMHLISEERVF